MVFVPNASERKAKYVAAIGGVPAAYNAGIQRTQGWKDAALGGQALYEEQMRNPNVLARRADGLQAVSEQDWKNKASTLGTQRIAAGMTAAADKQAQNYEPIAEALRGVNLQARTSDPMANIDNRVKPIVAAAVGASRKRR